MVDPRRTQSQVREEMLSGITGLLPAIRQAAEDWVPQTGKALADIYGGLPQAIVPKMITGALSTKRAPSSEPSFVSDKSIGAERYAPGTTERRLATAMDLANPLLAVAATPRAYQIAGKAAANAVNRAIAEGRGPLAQMLAPAMPMAVVKPKGGNWLSGSVENALAGLKRGPRGGPSLSDLQEELAGYRTGSPSAERVQREIEQVKAILPINSWIEGPLTKYVKTRMASPDDEVRKLAEQGVLHYEPAMMRERSPLMEKVVGRRETAGFPIQGLGDSPLARNWENTSDSIIRNLEARDLSSAERAASFGGKSGIPGDTVVHEMNPFASGAGISDLGFPHLIDELSNALNPQSGLPRNLLLTPEAVQNMSMEKAVRRVADINAWRAAQKVETNRRLAEQASLVREYAENNPKGLRWVELKAQAEDDAARKALADQLKYEGDKMQNCVGGYCDAVLSGRSRIFSLRDAKGEPHVTVEVRPPVAKSLQNYQEELAQRVKAGELDENEMVDLLDRAAENTSVRDTLPQIIQIKGKQNRAPNPEYLPFVQDFVRNSPLGGQWSDVGDLGNTGLRRITEEGLRKQLGDYVTEAEWAKHMEGFASGGSVTPQTPKPGTETLTGGVRGVKLDDQHWSYFL